MQIFHLSSRVSCICLRWNGSYVTKGIPSLKNSFAPSLKLPGGVPSWTGQGTNSPAVSLPEPEQGCRNKNIPWVSFLDVGSVQSHGQRIYSDFCQQTSLAEGQLEIPDLGQEDSASSVVWLHLCAFHWTHASLCAVFILKRRGLSLAKQKDFSGGERLVQLELAAC